MQQCNDWKHTSKSISEWLIKTGFGVAKSISGLEISRDTLERPKKSVHDLKLSNVTELKKICKKEWDKIHP